jgi:hypothetical protein
MSSVQRVRLIALLVVTGVVAIVVIREKRHRVEYWSTDAAAREEYQRAVVDLGYTSKQVANVGGQPTLLVEGVSESDARKLECKSLSISARKSDSAELIRMLRAKCAP